MRPDLTRRRALGLAVGGTVTIGGCFALPRVGSVPAGARFERDLPIPPVLAPIRVDGSGAHYEIEQREARIDILPGKSTTAWTYNGIFPGPTIRVRRGEPATVRHVNNLKTSTVVHLHGGHTPPESDGFPTDVILPAAFAGGGAEICGSGTDWSKVQATIGNTRNYVYPNNQRAATLWYHDHCMGNSGHNTYMGLAGFYIVDDEVDAALPLPKGPYDIPLMMCTRQFDERGAMVYEHHGYSGADGDVMLVNGAAWPRLRVERRKYRFRFLNADNAKPVELALSNGQPLVQIATDGGLLAAPVMLSTLPLTMAERAEVVIDFSRYGEGTRISLRNLRGTGPLSEIMCFDVHGGEVQDPARVPERLGTVEQLRPADAVRTREFRFGAMPGLMLNFPPIYWTINNQRFDPERVDAAPKLGDVEIWRFVHEKTIFPKRCHPPHVHLVNFQVIERNGRAAPSHEGGWKDTVALEGHESVTVIMRFDGYRGRYLLHCHNIEHEDHDMMVRFDVV